MQITVNGRTEKVPTGSNLRALIEQLGLAGTRLAIELNKEIVERDRWSNGQLEEDDSVEIVEFVGGG